MNSEIQKSIVLHILRVFPLRYRRRTFWALWDKLKLCAGLIWLACPMLGMSVLEITSFKPVLHHTNTTPVIEK